MKTKNNNIKREKHLCEVEGDEEIRALVAEVKKRYTGDKKLVEHEIEWLLRTRRKLPSLPNMQFEETGNPWYVLFEFVFDRKVFHENPPDRILDFIADRLEKFLLQEGKISLDEAFGFSPKRGQKKDSGPIGRVQIEIRDHILAYDVLYLTQLGYDVPTACKLVYEEKCGNKSLIAVPTPATIEKIYHRLKFYKNHALICLVNDYLQDEQNKKAFLESFPNAPRPKYKPRIYQTQIEMSPFFFKQFTNAPRPKYKSRV